MNVLRIYGQRQRDFYKRETDFTPMLRVTIPFTNEVLLDTTLCREDKVDDLVINRFDEAHETLELSVRTLLADDIAVFIINLKSPGSVLLNIETGDNARVMTFILSGSLTVNSLSDGAGNLTLFENTCYSFRVADTHRSDITICGEVTLFIIYLNAGSLRKLVPPNEMYALKTASFQTLTTAISSIVHTVISQAKNGDLHRILLVAKVLELLFLDLEQLKKNAGPSANPTFRNADRLKLEAARKLIGQNLQAPCSLIELAHKVGLNDFKLKKGFREVFGTTVFGYLNDLRMDKAQKMLLNAHSVSEVAHEVGYKNAHHFAVAFKKRFNLLPSQVKRS